MAYWKPPRTGQQAMQVARMRMPPGAVCGGLPGATSTISALPPQLAQHCSASRTGTMIMRRAGVDRDRRRCRQLRSQGWHTLSHDDATRAGLRNGRRELDLATALLGRLT